MQQENILLLSGGIESSTLLYQLNQSEKASSQSLRGLFIDYGQRAAKQEHRAASAIASQCQIPLTTLDMSKVGEQFRQEQEKKLHIPIPHRNLVALSLALSYASQHQAQSLYIAVNQDDLSAYPSADGDFLQQFRAICQTLGPIELKTPLVDMTKADIVALGTSLGVPYRDTYSCMLGYDRPCGHCSQCISRREAFIANGLDEPCLPYR